ncbi:multiple monosaccharide ABC transporter permease [Enemella evansiae]|uniref:Xylose transport system permease protein XylH n=1 Tax=Enemella evansiae TaxID=2016499 RepID=A0A255GPB7_9ACTN|nr:multiple monosaccharide ABC transporter permease [Enemella evansiae]PFG65589.1 putative multiple sugar transport system permease protein [Propionibacteriaceae bacterium ES.041]OYN96347.1 sugar ABC transporter permease [Enemella evansiae]OYN98780.1 sugar ABC transporter permease [Enemella evansiae]OYO01864.1 sugar ABC transporter permease [Enemella evansiae]OYO10963.1 sugar ABC transporter permease [Enemella evansiae]
MSTSTTEAPQTPAPETSHGVGAFLASRLRQVGLIIALAVIILLFQVLTDGNLLTPRNVTSIINQNAYVLILAIGMVMIIIAGHIDLSVGSVVAFVGAMSGIFIVKMGMPWWLGVVLSLAIGALIGAWQGFWVAYVGIPAFIVTLAGMLTFRGLTQMVLQNVPITPFPAEYTAIGSGFLPDLTGGQSVFEILTLILGAVATIALVASQVNERRKRVRLNLESDPIQWFVLKLVVICAFLVGLTFVLASYQGTPIVLVILAALILIYSTVMSNSVFGRNVYARGGNLLAAQLSGVNTKKVDFLLFVNMGVLAGIAGIAFTARTNSALPNAGSGFELDAIAAVFIGGAAVTGGVGTVTGAMIGGLTMGVLNSGMSLLGLGSEVQSFIKGFVLLLAVAFDIFNKRRGANA